MVKLLQVLAVVGSVLALPAWADDVGKIEAEGGTITIVDANGAAKPAVLGSTVDNGDVVSSAANSWVVLNMYDGASLTLRPDSRFRIVAYHFEDDVPSNNKSWLELITGTLRSITGLIGKQNPRDYSLKTPTATVGIRGTDHETSVIDADHATDDAPAGTYDNVNDGETSLKTEQGEVAVQPGKAAYLSPENHGAPRLLEKPPAFLARYHEFDHHQGIDKVLGQLHQRVGNGAFGAHPDLRERLQRQYPERFHAQHSNLPALNGHDMPGGVGKEHSEHANMQPLAEHRGNEQANIAPRRINEPEHVVMRNRPEPIRERARRDKDKEKR